ncbi:tetratricopeptide repeat protein [uncultured Polaribacter sp.]|uniref:tetratricopeptide repeat protein n=1 Tax=uncultured Polaribacter sp. TaxID=174711 RepID=UPI002613EED3|nr:tetratricopeptide repeat protein [uncultured Polaribacter sp.]
MRFVFFKKRFLIGFVFLISVTCYSQQTIAEVSVASLYNKAVKLYNSKAYAAAQEVLHSIDVKTFLNTNLHTNIAYYNAMCGVKLNQLNADEKVLAFIEENPASTKKSSAIFNVANYYYANRQVAESLKWYQKIDVSQLSNQDKKELQFKMGYAYVVSKKLTAAKKLFLLLLNDPKYGNDAKYYYGYIAYKLEDFETAEATLLKISNNSKYRAKTAYYLLDINFQARKFQYCIVEGKKLIKKLNRRERTEKSEISKIIGESYFNLKKYEEAIAYLKNYRGKKGKWNNVDYYQLGFAYYTQNDFEKAISNFNKIIGEKNAVAQNAYYHLGECYLKLDKKLEALNAFKTASQMSFSKKIKEDAALNYAKLSYEAGNPFKSVAEVLQDYLKEYPNSTSFEQINDLVVSSYLHQQDYDGALAFLSQRSNSKNTALISEISLYRGLQLFNDEKIAASLPYFVEAKRAQETSIKDKARYWEAESLYRLGKYQQAFDKFIRLKREVTTNSNEFALIDYNIGYASFKLKDYKNAAFAFRNFLNNNNAIEKNLKEDALIRLGDGYYAQRNFRNAIKSYSEVLQNKGAEADYAQYQIGMSYGFVDDNATKINALTNVVNNYSTSTLKDDALFQLANTYTLIKENGKAHEAYNRLIDKHSNSVFLPKALVRQGLLYYNGNNGSKALEKFKKVASQFPNSPDALEAVANARNVYIDDGNLDGYVSWVKTLKFVNVTNSDLDDAAFAVAENKYFESKEEEDIKNSLKKYLQSYAKGVHRLKANYYLADVLFNAREFDKSIPYYQVVIAQEQNEFSEDSLSKLSQIYLEKEVFNKALPLLTRLEKEAYNTENILYAQSNLMKGYYQTNMLSLAKEYAHKILSKDKLDDKLVYDAKIIIARTSFKNKDFLSAERYYKEVENNASGELKAEALYFNAYFKNQKKEYASSNIVIQNLIANYSSYKYWAVKSYVVMGKNYYGLNDVYQATFVLESVIKNFQQFKDIVTEAQLELKKIKENEAKTNTSVSPLEK